MIFSDSLILGALFLLLSLISKFGIFVHKNRNLHAPGSIEYLHYKEHSTIFKDQWS